MAQETTTTLDGMFKKRYGDKLEDLVPDHADFAEAIKFEKRPALGDRFEFPVRVQRAQGFTFSTGGTAYALNDAKPGLTLPASVQATSYTMREQVAYDAAARGVNDETSFGDVFDEIVRDMVNTMGFHRELAILYGQTSIGTSNTAGAASSPQTFNLTTASSAIGLWLQLVGADLDAYDTTLTTQRNTNAAIVLASASLDTDGQTVVLSLTGNTADLDAIIVGDKFVPRGWISSGVFAGVDKVATTTGSLCGIAATTYPLWRANESTFSSGQATMLRFLRSISVGIQRGGRKGKRWKAMVSYPSWNDLNNNLAALRRYAESVKGSVDAGTMGVITFYGPGIQVDIVASALVKNGEAFVAEWDSCFKRVGATDITFTLPGSSPSNPRFFRELESNAGFEIRGYWQQAIIPMRPASLVKCTNIVNSAG